MISITRWKQIRRTQQWNKEGKKEEEGIFHTYISVSLVVLGLFQTPVDAVEGLNISARVVKEEQICLKNQSIKIQTIIYDKEKI